MDFNITKCAVVSLVTTKKKPFLHDYLMDGQQIPRCENQDYLGVTINHKLSWKPHITKIKNKANRTLGLIRCTLHAAPQQVRKQAYEALVWPTLEYATCAWAPHTKLDIQAIEQVQRAAARYVCGDYRRRSSVTAMINKIEWDILHIRRTLRDQTMFYKVYHGQVGISLPPSMLRTTGQGVSTSSSCGLSQQTVTLSTLLLCLLHSAYPCGMLYPWMLLLQPLRKYFNQQRCQWSEHFRHITPIFSPARHVFICKYKLYSTMLIDGVTHCIHSNLITFQAVYYWRTDTGSMKVIETGPG